MKYRQRVNFKQPESHIKMITFVGEPGKPFRILLEAPMGGYFGTIFLSEAEMKNVRNAIDMVLKGR